MEIGHVQEFLLPRPDPFLPFVPLALRAVPVATTVVAQVQLVTCGIIAPIDMPPKGRGTAFAKGMERAKLPASGTNAR